MSVVSCDGMGGKAGGHTTESLHDQPSKAYLSIALCAICTTYTGKGFTCIKHFVNLYLMASLQQTQALNINCVITLATQGAAEEPPINTA